MMLALTGTFYFISFNYVIKNFKVSGVGCQVSGVLTGNAET
jgi:hypothetical protein